MEINGSPEPKVGLGVEETEMDAEPSFGGEEEEAFINPPDSFATEQAESNTEPTSPTGSPREIAGISLEPFVGMIFESELEAYQLYNEYSKQMGFGIRKKLCRRSKTNNDVIAGWYVCSRQGVYVRRGKAASPRHVTRMGCPAELKIKRLAVKKWQVTEFVREHNHELSPENSQLFRSHRKVLAPEKDLIEIMSRNVGLREHTKAVNKEQHKFLSAVDAHALHMYFMRMRSKSPSFSYAMHLDKEQRVRIAFWADPMSKMAYSHFGDAVTLDATYLSGRYKMPFVTFVGVNHHGQPILLGCALLADEATTSYTWLFQAWLEAMSGRPPKALITDRSESISAAVSKVFPETRHRYCLWHILQSFSKKLGYVCRAQDSFMKKFQKCIYDSMTSEEFEKRWWKFMHRFGLMNDEWLQSLYSDRRQWVPVYLKDTFFAGLSISQRGESLNSFFDKYISRNTNLKEFLEKYELAVESRLEDEAQEDIRSSHLIPKERTNPSPFELQLSNVYTKNIFEKFLTEVLGISSVFASKIGEDGENYIYLVKAYEMQEGDMNRKVIEKEYKVVLNASVGKIHCICCLFEFKGYLCRHALAVFLASSVLEIPPHYILRRWTKDAKTILVLNVGLNGQDDCSGSITRRFNDICVRCIKLAHEASLSKKSYDVALRALQEALEKVVYENNNPRKFGQNYNPRNTGYYKFSEGSRGNNLRPPMLVVPNHLGTKFVMCDPQVFQATGVPHKRLKCVVEKRASELQEHNYGYSTQFEYNDTACSKVHESSGIPTLIDGCSTQKIIEPTGQLDQLLVNTTNKENIISNDILPCLSQEGPIDIDD